jgi:hypothetical protein
MNFTVGQAVSLHTRMKSNLLGQEWDDFMVNGTVVKNPSWLDNDYVSVHTGYPEYPVSYVNKSLIVGFKFEQKRSSMRVFKVKSKDKEYMVNSLNGRVSCDCVGFQFRSKCKHSDSIKLFLDKENA